MVSIFDAIEQTLSSDIELKDITGRRLVPGDVITFSKTQDSQEIAIIVEIKSKNSLRGLYLTDSKKHKVNSEGTTAIQINATPFLIINEQIKTYPEWEKRYNEKYKEYLNIKKQPKKRNLKPSQKSFLLIKFMDKHEINDFQKFRWEQKYTEWDVKNAQFFTIIKRFKFMYNNDKESVQTALNDVLSIFSNDDYYILTNNYGFVKLSHIQNLKLSEFVAYSDQIYANLNLIDYFIDLPIAQCFHLNDKTYIKHHSFQYNYKGVYTTRELSTTSKGYINIASKVNYAINKLFKTEFPF